MGPLNSDPMHELAAALAAAPQFADLATDRPRSTGACARHASIRAAHTPVESTQLLSGIAAIAHRYTGQTHVVIARPDPEGNLWQVLVSHLHPEMSWRNFVSEVERRDNHRQHDAVPARSIAASSTPAVPAAHFAIILESEIEPPDSDQFDFVFRAGADKTEIGYSADLFDAATVERIMTHLEVLVVHSLREPDADVSRLPVLDASERHTLLTVWNNTTEMFHSSACVHQLVSAQAARNPDKTAVEFESTAITYRELETQANQLANHLITQGVRRNDLVGVYLERSTEMVVALLAILKCGAAYVPLDPNFPADRLAMMIEDADLQTFITQNSLASTLNVATAVASVNMERDLDALRRSSEDDPLLEVNSSDLMYVIFTSGSTGRPKGVMVEHRSAVNFLEAMAHKPGLAARDRLLAVTTLSFDIAALEIFLPLIVGATVCIAPKSVTLDPVALIDELVRSEITVMQATPATWRMLFDAQWPGDLKLKALCGGEALSQSLAESLATHVGEAWNMYGPTETTIWSTIQRIQPSTAVSIGTGIANTTLYVLDRYFEPVPIGVAGELLIGGEGLARGYLGLTEMTADRFVPDPFAEHRQLPDAPAPRLYRTGDLVRYRVDGRIEFLGRIDNQVKVRGFRIELGDIESALDSIDEIDEAIVVARPDSHGDIRLIAYYTTRTGARTPSANELRVAVKSMLPRYMVPSLAVPLTTMPRTPNGKTDRKAMPEPDWSAVTRDTPYVAPRTDTEQRMVKIWSDQLKIDQIGVQDDFFDLGVESIVAARLFGRIEEAFDIKLPLGTVFANPTVAALSEIVDGSATQSRYWKSLVPIQPAGPLRPLFGVHGGAGTVLLYAELARRLSKTGRPFYGLQAQGLYGTDPIHITVPQMAKAYLQQIRSVQAEGPYLLVGYCFGAIVAHEIAHMLESSGESVELLISVNGPARDYIEGNDLRDEDDIGTSKSRPDEKRWLARRIRNALAYRWNFTRIYCSVATRRPAPESLRSAYYIIRVSLRAQMKFRSARVKAPMAVFRAEGLYVEDDLGWNRYLSNPATTLIVPGAHSTARDSMANPLVHAIETGLLTLLQSDFANSATKD